MLPALHRATIWQSYFKMYQKLTKEIMNRIKQDFTAILHLAELYFDQYRERNLCLSPLQNEVLFSDFVHQYYSAINWGKEPKPVINTDMPLF